LGIIYSTAQAQIAEMKMQINTNDENEVKKHKTKKAIYTQ
jgi:hypothetical protein